MSANVLADLDSFYRQKSSSSDNREDNKKEEEWGDFQESQSSAFQGQFKVSAEVSYDEEAPDRRTKNAHILFDAIEESQSQETSRKSSLKLADSKAFAKYTDNRKIPNSVGNCARSAKKEEKKIDLLDFSETVSDNPYDRAKGTNNVAKPESTSITAKPLGEEEEWADFSLTPAVQNLPKADESAIVKERSPNDSPGQLGLSEQEVPPTNVPPPALILSLFLQVIDQSKSELLRLTNICRNQTSQIDNRRDAEFLRAYVETTRILARVIAGRKLRWKRDHLLSQGMKLGPASTKGPKGMKLASIDKAELGKEEKEVLDTVEIWRDQVGRLRTVVTAFVTNGFNELGSIPDIQANIPVKALNENEGGISSSRPCALCGLKRNERVNRVDVSVQDSFGEWWNEPTNMHRTCRYFWQTHKSKLQTS